MSPTDAAKLLDLPADAPPEQLEARFLELRRKLEDKIAKAPTPGLQAKYRESLAEITTAFETLTLAADSSSLPVAQKQTAGGGVISPAASVSTPKSTPHAPSSGGRKSGGKELLIVAVVAVLVLAGGSWFVLKTRAENAEKQRVAAEAKAEAERQVAAAKAEQERLVQAARLEAEEKKKTEEAERVRQDKLSAQLRADLAEAKVAWEALEREERTAERRLAELKSDLRSMRDQPAGKVAEAQAVAAAQQDYHNWLSETLARHPAKVARGRAEELLSARQPDDAKVAMQELSTSLRALEAEIPRQRAALLDLDGEITFKTTPDATWSLTDAFGRVRKGKGPATFKDVAVGPAEVRLAKDGWPARTEQVVIRRTEPTVLDATFAGANVRIASEPAGARVHQPNGKEIGSTPLQLSDLAPGNYHLVLKLTGHYDQPVYFATPGAPAELKPVKMRARVTKPVKPEWRLPARFIYETSSSWANDGNRSTGTFAKDAWRYNASGSSASKDEWRFSESDEKGNWTICERRVLLSNTSQVPTGLVVRYVRQPDGKFAGEFISGDVTDPTFRNAYLSFPAVDATWGNSWIDQAWPPEATPVGGSWTVQGVALPGLPASTVTGRLIAFDRTPTADWVTLQFEGEKVTKDQAEVRQTASLTLRVNLGEGYIASIDGSHLNQTTVKAVLIGQIGTDSRGNYSYKLTVPAERAP